MLNLPIQACRNQTKLSCKLCSISILALALFAVASGCRDPAVPKISIKNAFWNDSDFVGKPYYENGIYYGPVLYDSGIYYVVESRVPLPNDIEVLLEIQIDRSATHAEIIERYGSAVSSNFKDGTYHDRIPMPEGTHVAKRFFPIADRMELKSVAIEIIPWDNAPFPRMPERQKQSNSPYDVGSVPQLTVPIL